MRRCGGAFVPMEGPDDVLALMDTGAEGVVALVRDAGATFLAPIYHELTAIICTSGTVRSHIGIVSREFQVPCVMACAFSAERAGGGRRGRARLLRRRGDRPWVTRPSPEDAVATANRLIDYHAPISKALTSERTSLESALIPVTAYIVVACAESYLRYPEMVRRIDAAMPAEEIGRRARRPGLPGGHLLPVVHQQLLPAGSQDHGDDRPVGRRPGGHRHRPRLLGAGRAGLPGRRRHPAGVGHGHLPALRRRPPSSALLAGVASIDDEDHRATVKRFSATLVNHLFLLYFDTRAGYGDTGPYPVPGHPERRLLVRDFYRLADGDFPWSTVAAAACRTTTSRRRSCSRAWTSRSPTSARRTTRPRTTSTTSSASRSTRPTACRRARSGSCPPRSTPGSWPPCGRPRASTTATSRRWSRDEKIRAGAYVYFTFLRPFAEVAGIADELDWSVPRDLPEPIYDFMSMMQGENAGVPEDEAYYERYPRWRSA